MNQSKFEVITCSWRKARENVCERRSIGFGSTADWTREWREIFLSQSRGVQVMQGQAEANANSSLSALSEYQFLLNPC